MKRLQGQPRLTQQIIETLIDCTNKLLGPPNAQGGFGHLQPDNKVLIANEWAVLMREWNIEHGLWDPMPELAIDGKTYHWADGEWQLKDEGDASPPPTLYGGGGGRY